jgi:hypothetical protein
MRKVKQAGDAKLQTPNPKRGRGDYFANSTTRVSRITVTRIWPGY